MNDAEGSQGGRGVGGGGKGEESRREGEGEGRAFAPLMRRRLESRQCSPILANHTPLSAPLSLFQHMQNAQLCTIITFQESLSPSPRDEDEDATSIHGFTWTPKKATGHSLNARWLGARLRQFLYHQLTTGKRRWLGAVLPHYYPFLTMHRSRPRPNDAIPQNRTQLMTSRSSIGAARWKMAHWPHRFPPTAAGHESNQLGTSSIRLLRTGHHDKPQMDRAIS